MNRPIAMLTIAFTFVASSVFIAAGAETPAPITLAGAITDEAQAQKAGEALGSHGVWLVRDKSRWKDLEDKLTAAGWSRGRSTAVRDIEFDKVNLVCVFAYGDEGDQFAAHKLTQEGDRVELQLTLSYIIYKQRARAVNKFHFLAVEVPKAATTKTTVSTFHPQNGGPYPSPDKALLEWSYEFMPERGDVVAGLTGAIKPAAATVTPGDDIRVYFELQFAPSSQVKGEGHFASAADTVYVWDGKYSNGYRNHAFLVQLPDGTTQLLRRAVQGDWDKNAPHPVAITASKPYVLPNWAEGDRTKSLKELGLKTTIPGRYTITGLYMQTASPTTPDGKPGMWGGDLATNTVVVEVK